jgi:NAD(P)-dependent dehydrogenase (short-subunit alcohol dehydrogenase family)
VVVQNNAGLNDSNAFIRNNDADAVFVVNGASRGIGLQFVKSLLQRAKGKIVACCRSPSTAHDLQIIVSGHPERVRILPLDLEQQSTIDDLGNTITKEYQRVDALFNVAGILGDGITTPGPERTLASIERDWLEKSLAVNVIGPVMLTKALSPLMRTTGRRTITVEGQDGDQIKIDLPQGRPQTIVANLSARVGSISDNRLGGWYSYRLSKSALNQATKTLGLELKRQGTW